MRTVLVISDFPIFNRTAHGAVAGRHTVVTATWRTVRALLPATDLVIADVTRLDRRVALLRLGALAQSFDILLCSLHENKVEVYQVRDASYRRTGTLPSLQALEAWISREARAGHPAATADPLPSEQSVQEGRVDGFDWSGPADATVL